MPPTLLHSSSRGSTKTSSRFGLLSLVAACIASASARASNIALEHVTTIAWPTDVNFGPVQTFTRMVAGDVNGDGVPDAIGLSGTKVVYFQDIGTYTALSVVPRLAKDVDFAPEADPNGHGALVLATDNGLEVLYVTHPSAGPDGFAAFPVITDGWAGALKVRSADLNGTHKSDYVGVEADGKTLIRRRDNVINGAPEQATLTLTRTVIDLQIVNNWYTGNSPVIAVLTSAGVFVYDQDWTLLEGFSHLGVPGGAITVVHERNQPDRVAWVMETPSGPQLLRILSAGTVVQTGPTLPTNLHVVAIAAGDLDGDGDDDVVMSHTTNYAPLCWKNNGFTNPVTTDPTFAIGLDGIGASAVDNRALPLVADLDLDGYADLIVAEQLNASYLLYLRQQNSSPSVLGSSDFYQVGTIVDMPNGATGLPVGLKFEWDQFPSAAGGVEVVVWEQPYTAPDYNQPPNSDSLTHYYFPKPNPPTTLDGHVAIAPMSIEMPDPGAECFSSVYWFEVRAVKSSDTLTAVGPTYVAAFVSYPLRAVDISQHGLQLSTSGTVVECDDIAPEHLNDEHIDNGNQRAPCVAPRRRMPDRPAGTVPTIHPLTPIPGVLTVLE